MFEISRRRFLAAGLAGPLAAILGIARRPARAASPFDGCAEVDIECRSYGAVAPTWGFIDTVNDREFHGAAAGTVRLGASKADLEIDRDGRESWRVTYSFAAFSPGWNNILRPSTGRYEPLLHNGKPLFPESNFDRLPSIGDAVAIRSRPTLVSLPRLA